MLTVQMIIANVFSEVIIRAIIWMQKTNAIEI